MQFNKIILLLAIISPLFSISQKSPNIIPKPNTIILNNGMFTIDKNTGIQYADKTLKPTAVYLSDCIKHISGIALTQNAGAKKQIAFVIDKSIANEGYQMNITDKGITIKASSPTGIFYGIQSLLQTLPAIRTNAPLTVQAMQITDQPRFQWRGMHLDVSRHFFSIEIIKEYLDLMASYKLNTFHWHLTDGGGWRLEIKKYPKLTEQAAWRVDAWGKPWSWYELAFNADKNRSTYGGYYTQEQAKEVVAYAAKLHITVVPEIEMPGHSEEVVAAYPQLSCHSIFHFGQSGDFFASKMEGNFCAGNDSSFTFIQDVLTEVMAIFPSNYIHIGGDEVEKESWKTCAKCQLRIKNESLKNEEELQSYFIKRIEKFVLAKNRKIIGWDEILEGGLAPTATVMSWRGEKGGVEAAKMKHFVVMTPGSPCYFDHYQAGPEGEPQAIGGFNSLMKVYNYEPIPKELNEEEGKFVLGAQGNVWTEYISTAEHLEYMVLPRMPALAEVLWSSKEQRNWDDFNSRLQNHFVAFEQKGLHYCAGNYTVNIIPNTVDGKLVVTLNSEAWNGKIFYTTHGEEPTAQSMPYTQPILVDSSIELKAVVVVNGRVMGLKAARQIFTFHKAMGCEVKYSFPVSDYYKGDGPNTLTDGIRGTAIIGKNWHGFSGKDMVATIDMGSQKSIHKISAGFLQAYNRWIFLPSSVTIEVSNDGVNFTTVQAINNPISTSELQVFYDFTSIFPSLNARYIFVSAKNTNCPEGHPGAGKAAWIFADEIIVE